MWLMCDDYTFGLGKEVQFVSLFLPSAEQKIHRMLRRSRPYAICDNHFCHNPSFYIYTWVEVQTAMGEF